MHVGLDLLFLSGFAGGVETYIRELVPAMRRVRPELRLTGFVPRMLEPPAWLEEIETVAVGLPGPSTVAMPLAQSLRLPLLARRAGVDLIHSPANFAPLISGGAPVVVTVHDLLHRCQPRLVHPAKLAGVRVFVDLPARRATRIITVSEASASDIARYLGRSRHDIDVTPPAAGPVQRPDISNARRPARPQVLSVGNNRAHKNLELVVRALALVNVSERPLLVLPGRGMDKLLGPLVRAMGLSDHVQMPGWVSASELERLYAASSAYICPSLFEGFGLPVLEAMQRGVPVACSDIPVLREVAGDAAAYFDPCSAQSAATTLRSLLGDTARATRLAALGLTRAAAFTWERTAELTLLSYERALAVGSRPHRAA